MRKEKELRAEQPNTLCPARFRRPDLVQQLGIGLDGDYDSVEGYRRRARKRRTLSKNCLKGFETLARFGETIWLRVDSDLPLISVHQDRVPGGYG